MPVLTFAAAATPTRSTPERRFAEGNPHRVRLGGHPGDPFYNVIKNGARQAKEDLGVDVEYKETSQYDFQEQKRLIEAAIARKPDGLVVSDESPDVLDPVIADAVDAGIPVVIANAMGPDTLETTGALGSSDRTSSRSASSPESA